MLRQLFTCTAVHCARITNARAIARELSRLDIRISDVRYQLGDTQLAFICALRIGKRMSRLAHKAHARYRRYMKTGW